MKEESKRVEVQVEGMHCVHCETTVGRALERAGV
ncbi:MAG TPA: cation transporter [Acidimicrobiia bacterium]